MLISSLLVLDKTEQLQKELSALQSEFDRVVFLLKIADPTGEAAKKRDSKVVPESSVTPAAIKKQPPMKHKETCQPGNPENVSVKKEESTDVTIKSSNKLEAGEVVGDAKEGKTVVYTVAKPQWLGAIVDSKIEGHQEAASSNEHESEAFVDYKDRKKILENEVTMESGIENAAPGLIIRKRKQVHESEGSGNSGQQLTSSSTGAGLVAEDAVALLLKHKRGYYASDEEKSFESQDMLEGKQLSKGKKPKKRVLGPEKPSFLESDSTETWVPPEGKAILIPCSGVITFCFSFFIIILFYFLILNPLIDLF